MADVFDAAKRSEVMSKIRSKNTKVELVVFRFLRKEGVYFQKHYARVPGKPDIALPRKKLAVFIDGDFWHGRTLDKLVKRREDAKHDFWIEKIKKNMERDSRQRAELEAAGWKLLVVWYSDLTRKRTRAETLEEIKKFLTLH